MIPTRGVWWLLVAIHSPYGISSPGSKAEVVLLPRGPNSAQVRRGEEYDGVSMTRPTPSSVGVSLATTQVLGSKSAMCAPSIDCVLPVYRFAARLVNYPGCSASQLAPVLNPRS